MLYEFRARAKQTCGSLKFDDADRREERDGDSETTWSLCVRSDVSLRHPEMSSVQHNENNEEKKKIMATPPVSSCGADTNISVQTYTGRTGRSQMSPYPSGLSGVGAACGLQLPPAVFPYL